MLSSDFIKYFRDLQFVYNPYIFRIKTDNLAPKKIAKPYHSIKVLDFCRKMWYDM
jgi:hypothetical protein